MTKIIKSDLKTLLINNFNEFDQHTYISTDYGVSVFNLDSLEFSLESITSI